jgi:hypothetical protein
MNMIRMDRIGMVASSTIQDMIDNSAKSNTSLHKAQRKDDKDQDKKTTRAAATGSKGVGIESGSVGGQDLSNMGDMRGKSSSGDDLFSSKEDEENEDDDALDRDLSLLTKDKIYKFKVKNFEEELDEAIREEDEKDRRESQEREEGEDSEKKEDKEEKKEKKDEVLDDIKDKEGEERLHLSDAEKEIKDGDPKHTGKDGYSSSGDKEKCDVGEEEIVLPQIQIRSSGLMMEMPEEEKEEENQEEITRNQEVHFETPSMYYAEEETQEVPDEIKNSVEFMREQNNRMRIKKMLVYYPNNDAAKLLVDQLYVLGEKILEACLNFGIKIVILKVTQQLSDIVSAAEYIGSTRVGYAERLRICFFGEEWLYPDFQNIYRFTTSVYLMGIAFDHATGGDSFASLKSPFVLNNYHSCKRGEEGHQFIDGLAAYSPVEYFAQTLEAFFQREENGKNTELIKKVFEGKLCTHDELYYTDICMYQYIDYLVSI